MLVTSQKLLDT